MSLVDLLCDEEDIEQTEAVDYFVNESELLELFRKSDSQNKRRILSYYELLVVCNEINDGKMYLYDVIDIKKETSNSLGE